MNLPHWTRLGAIRSRLLPLLFVAIYSGLSAQPSSTGRLTGRVANQATGEYLEGATVTLTGREGAVLTDAGGRFAFTGLAPADYTVRVVYTGMDPVDRPVTVGTGETVLTDITLTAAIYQLAPITVSSEREGAAKAITLQKNSDNIRNIVDAEAFGTVADGNVGDLVKLLPGLNAEGKNGETWAIRVRGLDPAMNSLTVDGFKTAGATLDADASRAFDVGVTPIEGISTVEVTKSPTPSQPADSMGGAINLISRSALDRKYTGPQLGGSAGVIMRSYRNHPAYNGRVSYQDLFRLGSDDPNLAVSFTASSNDNYIPNNRVQQSWTTNSATNSITALNEFRVFEARITRRRAGTTFNVDYRLSPATLLKVRAAADFFNQKSYENYVAWRTASVTAQHWQYWKKRRSNNIAILGEHKFEAARLDFGLQTGWSRSRNADQDRDDHNGGRLLYSLTTATNPRPAWVLDLPETTGLMFTSVRQTAGLDFRNPANWVLNANGFRVRNIQFENDSLNAYLNFTKTLALFSRYNLEWKTGTSYVESKVSKTHDEKSYSYAGTGGLASFVVNDANPYPLYGGETLVDGQPYATQWMDTGLAHESMRTSPALWSYNRTTYYNTLLQNDNTITEGVLAGYTQGSVKLGKFSLLTGVRYERTSIMKRYHQRISGVYQPDRTKRTEDNDNYFPSAHLKYAITPNLIARFSYSQTIGRPNYSNLITDENIDFGTKTITRANTDLEPMTSQNFDYTLEYYFEPVGMLSANYFEKRIKNFISDFNFDLTPESDIFGYGSDYYDPVSPWKIRSKTNSGLGKVRGIELAYQQQFTFLPGPLKGLGGYANYTYIETESQKGGTAETGSLTNYVPELINVGLSWRYRGFQARVRYNWKDRYLMTDAPLSINRVYIGAAGRLDINTSYQLNRKVSLFFDVFNATNTHEKFYQGEGMDQYLTRDEDNGARYSLGVNVRL